MRRVLFVSYYFPPLGGIGSIRAASFVKHLPEYGWLATVLTPRDGAYYRDPELAFDPTQVVRSGSWELSRTGKKILRTGGSDTAAANVAGVKSRVRQLARQFVYFPDGQIGWYPPAVGTATKELRRETFDAVFSSSFPVTAHLVAAHIKARRQIPWIAEYRDPWSEMLPADSTRRRIALRLERWIARESDALVMTSPSWAHRHSELWGRSVTTILNGHDGATERNPSPPSGFTLAYLGSFYPKTQRLDTVWHAVQNLNSEGQMRVDRIRFVGEAHPQLLCELQARGLAPLVEVTGFLSHQDALRVTENSSAVLVAGPVRADGILRGHIVAKIAEYLSGSRPVIYVGDPTSDAADLLRQYDGTYVVPTDDVASMVTALKASAQWSGHRRADDLSRIRLTGRLAALLDEVST